jgi:hypothetical protein
MQRSFFPYDRYKKIINNYYKDCEIITQFQNGL